MSKFVTLDDAGAERLAEGAPTVVVEFKSSSTKGGGEGYRVVVTNGATEVDVENAVYLARGARDRCRAALGETGAELSPEAVVRISRAINDPEGASA